MIAAFDSFTCCCFRSSFLTSFAVLSNTCLLTLQGVGTQLLEDPGEV